MHPGFTSMPAGINLLERSIPAPGQSIPGVSWPSMLFFVDFGALFVTENTRVLACTFEPCFPYLRSLYLGSMFAASSKRACRVFEACSLYVRNTFFAVSSKPGYDNNPGVFWKCLGHSLYAVCTSNLWCASCESSLCFCLRWLTTAPRRLLSCARPQAVLVYAVFCLPFFVCSQIYWLTYFLFCVLVQTAAINERFLVYPFFFRLPKI